MQNLIASSVMSPLMFLGLTLLVTAAGVLCHVIARRRTRHQLQRLAAELKLAYSMHDRFGLSDRVAEKFPIPGAAALRVIDLLYGSEGDGYRYLFSAEYTAGVIRSKRRTLQAVTFREPKGRTDPAGWSPMQLAPEDLPIVEQYRLLAGAFAAKAQATPESSSAEAPPLPEH